MNSSYYEFQIQICAQQRFNEERKRTHRIQRCYQYQQSRFIHIHQRLLPRKFKNHARKNKFWGVANKRSHNSTAIIEHCLIKLMTYDLSFHLAKGCLFTLNLINNLISSLTRYRVLGV